MPGSLRNLHQPAPNAGHPPALLVRAEQATCTTLNADGVLLGINKDASFAEIRVRMQTGDMVVFYTDGVTETRNEVDDMFGLDRLAQAVSAHRADDPEVVVDEVLSALGRFAGARQREDDLTIVVMKLVGS